MTLNNTSINLIYCGSISKLLLIHFASMYIYPKYFYDENNIYRNR